MLIFNLNIHNLRGRVLEKFQETRVVAYTDDGYIKCKLSVTLQVLSELKRVLKEDGGLEFNVSKTSILPKDITQQSVFDVEHNFITTSHSLTQDQPSGDVVLVSFFPEGFIGIGVPIGTDTFVWNFVPKTCRDIIDDVEKLDNIYDGFIQYQYLGFTRILDSNTPIHISYSLIITSCNNSM
jgi:hypothetical protein